MMLAINMLTKRTQRVPPATPVYSYHCTQLTVLENTPPKLSHGHLAAQR